MIDHFGSDKQKLQSGDANRIGHNISLGHGGDKKIGQLFS